MSTTDDFLWVDFVRHLNTACAHVEDQWRIHHKMEPVIYVWYVSPILDDAGRKVDGVVCYLLQPNEDIRQKIQTLHIKNHIYGYLFIDPSETRLKLWLETPANSKVVTYPIYRSADVRILGEKKATIGAESLGVLWGRKG
jgi:hypothetical protein